ncbi:MAG: hypothetical protein GY762_22665 [Proteobacteria bacterium]|nr:hypothetical protein [Pseudomonadota bacterium]
MRKLFGILIFKLIMLIGLALSYWYVMRPWHLRWGSSDDELNRALPGDDMLPDPKINATHAVTIQASPEEIWPWLVQIGQGRGGFYSYDVIENAMGLDIHSAAEIQAEHQDLAVGDLIPLSPDGIGLEVSILEPENALVLMGDSRIPGKEGAPPMRPGDYLATTWGFFLVAQEDGSTRLVERFRADWNDTSANNFAYRTFIEPGAFVMERKMLLGIKDRAER